MCGEGQTLNNLATIYASQAQWAAANAHYQRALTLKRAVGDPHSEGITHMNLGDLYAAHLMPTKAKQSYAQALAKLHPASPEAADLNARLPKKLRP